MSSVNAALLPSVLGVEILMAEVIGHRDAADQADVLVYHAKQPRHAVGGDDAAGKNALKISSSDPSEMKRYSVTQSVLSMGLVFRTITSLFSKNSKYLVRGFFQFYIYIK